jgi:hypothetical protein
MSHFRDIGSTRDVGAAYGVEGSRALARTQPDVALTTADNLEYFVEEYSMRGGAR